MVKDRDVAAFDRRARGYESGAIGQMHQRIGERVAGIALAVAPNAGRVLDVGCGTGALLRLLADRLPGARRLDGVDPAPSMIESAAAARPRDPRIGLSIAAAEHLPLATDSVDLVVAVTSFDHWADQRAGLAECRRVLRPGAPLVLCDLFSTALLPTIWLGRRDRTRTVSRAAAALRAAGFGSLAWYPGRLIKTVVAS